MTGLFFARTESPDLEDLSKIKPNYDDPAPVKPGSPVAPADPSDPTPTDPTPTDPTPSDPSDPTPTDPDPPSGTSCSDYGVGSGTTYHTQYNDSTQWKGGSCPNCTIANSGCPMVAILNAIIRVTNCKLTKQMFAKHMKEYTNNFTSRKGLFNSDSSWSNKGGDIVNHYANYYKVNIKEISKSRVKAALEAGHAVVARGQSSNDNNRVFSSGGHYVAFVGQGIYQLYTYTAGGTNSNAFLPAGPVSDDEFARQTDIATSIMKDMIESAGPGCQNPETWSEDPDIGALVKIDKVKDELRKLKGQSGLTFCGGEPLLQAKACYEIAKFCHEELGWNVWSFTGLIYDQLPHEGPVWDFICELDALIDGPFIQSQRDLSLKFRGSKNQRILHLKKGEIVSQE